LLPCGLLPIAILTPPRVLHRNLDIEKDITTMLGMASWSSFNWTLPEPNVPTKLMRLSKRGNHVKNEMKGSSLNIPLPIVIGEMQPCCARLRAFKANLLLSLLIKVKSNFAQSPTNCFQNYSGI